MSGEQVTLRGCIEKAVLQSRGVCRAGNIYTRCITGRGGWGGGVRAGVLSGEGVCVCRAG